jgi:hypothetical protein
MLTALLTLRREALLLGEPDLPAGTLASALGLFAIVAAGLVAHAWGVAG